MSDTLIQILGLTLGWGLIALGALLILRALFADRSRGRRRCPRCWYSMDGVPSLTCPECGRSARKERRLFKTRRRYGRALAASILPVLGVAALATSGIIRLGWIGAVPTTALVALVPIDLRDWDGSTSTITFTNWLSYPAVPPPPAPLPAAATWRDDMAAELQRRVLEQELWDWQAELLARRIRVAAASQGKTLGITNCRDLLDVRWCDGAARKVRSPASAASNDPSLFALQELRQLLLDYSTHLQVTSESVQPRGGFTYSLTDDADVSFVGPIALDWKAGSNDGLARLISSQRSAAPSSPACVTPGDGDRLVDQILSRLQKASLANLPEEPLLRDVLDAIGAAAETDLTVDWQSLWDAGIYREFAKVHRPRDDSAINLLNRGFTLSTGDRRLLLRWAITNQSIVVDLPANERVVIPQLPKPTIRVYDVRPILAARLAVSATPDPVIEQKRILIDVESAADPHAWWSPDFKVVNGRLIATTQPGVHASIESILSRLADEARVKE